MLNKLTSNSNYLEYADQISLTYKNFVANSPMGFSQFLSGLQFSLGSSYEIIIVGEKESPETKEIIQAINKHFIPNKVVLLLNEENRDIVEEIAPYTKGYPIIENQTVVYVCKNYVCNLPTSDKEKVIEL